MPGDQSQRGTATTPEQRDQALEALRLCVEAVTRTPEDVDTWRGWLARIPAGDGAALVGVREVDVLLERMATVPGYSARATAARRILRSYHTPGPQIRVVQGGNDAPAVSLSERMAADGYHAPDGLKVPDGYRLRGSEIVRVTSEDREDVTVSERPIAIVGRATDAETGEASVSVAWRYEDRWISETVSRYTVADARALVALSRRGAPVDSTTASEVVRWLRRQESAADGLPSVASMERLGWTPDGTGYLWGTTSIGQPVHLVPPGEGERSRAEGYRARGTLEGWVRDVWTPSRDQPAGLVILAALAAPLVQVLDGPGWTMDIGGPPGTGKSAALKAALSACGDPAALWHLWGPNWAGVRNAIQFAHSVPCVLDDTKHTAGDWSVVQRVVYTAYDRASQALGQVGGGTQRARPVRTIVLSTGESRIASHCADAGGAASRMLTVDRAPWADVDTAPRIHDAVQEHHGHVLPLVVRWLLDHRERWGDLRTRWREIHRARTEGERRADVIRVAQLPAMLEIAASVVRRAAGIDVPRALLGMAWDMATAAEAERDTASTAWRCVEQYRATRPDRWAGVADARTPYLGRQTGAAVYWTREGLDEALRSGGYSAADVLPMWAARGWLETATSGGYQVRRTIGPVRVWVYGLLHGRGPDAHEDAEG
jgi:hypothetical protein